MEADGVTEKYLGNWKILIKIVVYFEKLVYDFVNMFKVPI